MVVDMRPSAHDDCKCPRNALVRYGLLTSVLAMSCLAQSPPADTGASTGQSRLHRGAMPGGERSMRGCVAQDESGGFELVAQRGNRVRLNSAEDLSSHVGQQVKESVAFGNADPGREAVVSVSPVASKKHSNREFRVTRLDVLSQTCLAPTKKK